MIDKSTLWLLLPRRVRRFPADLALTVGLVLLACGFVLAGRGFWTPFRLVFGFLFLFFLPGYALVAALFPESGGETTTGKRESTTGEPVLRGRGSVFHRRIDGVERLVLSIAASLAVVPLIGYLVSYSPWGLQLVPSLVTVGGFTVVCAVVAAFRRLSLPDSERFSVPYRAGYARVRAGVSKDAVVARPLNVVLVLSLIVASAGIVYTTTTPRSDEQFTEFYLATENESGGIVVDDYPRNFTRGEAKPLRVGIENHEYERTNYTVVVLLQRTNGGNGSTNVTAERQLDRFHATIDHDETVVENRSIEPSMTGDRLRLVFLLYRGTPPASPSAENAYRRAHLRIRVEN